MVIHDEFGTSLAGEICPNPLQEDTQTEARSLAREDLAARQENARLSDEQFKRGVLLTSQRDASHAQAMKARPDSSRPAWITF